MKKAEKTFCFSKQNDLFHNVFKSATIGMAVVDLDGRWLEVNDSLCQILGYSRDELLKKNYKDLTHLEDIEKDLPALRKISAGEIDVYRFEKRYIHKENNLVWVSMNVSLLRNEDQKPEYLITQVLDITEQKTTALILKERETELELILHNSPDVIARLDRDLNIIFMNSAIEKIFGFPKSTFIGKHLRDALLTKSIYPEWEAILTEAIEQKQEITLDFASIFFTGKHFIITLKPEIDANGEVGTILATFKDISERRKAEIALQKREIELNTILSNTPMIVARLDKDLKVLYVNSVIESEIAIAAENYLGKKMLEGGIPKIFADKFEENILEVLEIGEIKEVEFYFKTTQGERHYFARFIPEFSGNTKEIETVLIFAVEITERKSSEIELKKLNAELKSALEQVTKLQGMLPICSYCKNIRDDKNYWKSVEEYLTEHSDAQFSHGICPDCYQSHVKQELEAFKIKKKSGTDNLEK